MTKEEKQLFDELKTMMFNIQTENTKFRADSLEQIKILKEQVDKKHAPIQFETDILRSCQLAMNETIVKVLTNHDSSLIKLTKSVIDEHSAELKTIISTSFKEVITVPEFKASIVTAFSHKVAKTIISNNDGLFDKVSNELKQDAIFKSKMVAAVANVIEECLINKNI